MGICLAMVRLSDAAIDEIAAAPKKVLHFWMQDEAPGPEPAGWLARLLGKRNPATLKCSVPREAGDETDLDKSWDAMDYLLSEGRKKEGLSRFLTEGGEPIPEEIGYGPPRVLRSVEVKRIAAFLEGVSPELLRRHYDGPAMDRAEVYPGIWGRDGEEGFEYVASYFESLCSFVREAAERGLGLMIIYT